MPRGLGTEVVVVTGVIVTTSVNTTSWLTGVVTDVWCIV